MTLEICRLRVRSSPRRGVSRRTRYQCGEVSQTKHDARRCTTFGRIRAVRVRHTAAARRSRNTRRTMPHRAAHHRADQGRFLILTMRLYYYCYRPGVPVLFIVYYYYHETIPPPGQWPGRVGRPGRERRENTLYSRCSVTLRAAVSHHRHHHPTTDTTTHARSVNPEKTTSHRACAHARQLRASFCVQCVRAPS